MYGSSFSCRFLNLILCACGSFFHFLACAGRNSLFYFAGGYLKGVAVLNLCGYLFAYYLFSRSGLFLILVAA